LAKAADLMMEKGALSVGEFVHMQSYLEVLTKNRKFSIIRIVTDSIPLKKQSEQNKSVELCSSLAADVMHMVHHNNSISGKFIM
jgi:ribose-phosphate pyrophosphokinase